MVVFISNLPRFATEKELCLIARLGKSVSLRIFKKRMPGGRLVRYALVPVRNKKQADRLIRRIQGVHWRDGVLGAHLYLPRITANERRRVDWRSHAWSGPERRNSERRLMRGIFSHVA